MRKLLGYDKLSRKIYFNNSVLLNAYDTTLIHTEIIKTFEPEKVVDLYINTTNFNSKGFSFIYNRVPILKFFHEYRNLLKTYDIINLLD
jgi:hypothetical protein